MKIVKKIFVIVLLLIGLILIVLFDYADRIAIFSKYTPEKDFNEFSFYKTVEAKQNAYERHFHDTLYEFPRCNAKKVKIFRNIPVISRITGKQVNKTEFLSFFNTPDNFNWSETTWTINETDYILRFYDFNNKTVGTIWICFDECGMTESIPFAPTMKFGGLSGIGKEKLTRMLREIYQLNQ